MTTARRMHWVKHWNTMRHDLAVKQLTDRQFRRWIWILEIAGQVDEDGYVPSVILRAEGVSKSDTQPLIRLGLCTNGGEGVLVTNWSKYQMTKASRVSDAARKASERSAPDA